MVGTLRDADAARAFKALALAPGRAHARLLDVADFDAPLLGSDALRLARGKTAGLLREFERWEALTRSTDG